MPVIRFFPSASPGMPSNPRMARPHSRRCAAKSLNTGEFRIIPLRISRYAASSLPSRSSLMNQNGFQCLSGVSQLSGEKPMLLIQQQAERSGKISFLSGSNAEFLTWTGKPSGLRKNTPAMGKRRSFGRASVKAHSRLQLQTRIAGPAQLQKSILYLSWKRPTLNLMERAARMRSITAFYSVAMSTGCLITATLP